MDLGALPAEMLSLAASSMDFGDDDALLNRTFSFTDDLNRDLSLGPDQLLFRPALIGDLNSPRCSPPRF